jgi:hypothetical protein
VHQETGYAIALNIPVLPLAIGIPPAQMISQLQAITVHEDLSDLKEKLGQVNLESVVLPPPARPGAIVEVADWPERRVDLMGQFPNRVLEMGGHAMVRQRGGLSSFSILDKDSEDPLWEIRDGDHPRSQYYHHLLREERRALERHARKKGCRLLIDPTVMTTGGPVRTRRIRLETLREFLRSMPDKLAQVVCSPRARDANITIVGDWFVAESRLRLVGEGWRQTFFNWHAPTVLRAARHFDQVFDGLMKESGVSPGDSRGEALAQIGSVLSKLGGGGPRRKPPRAAGQAE